MGFLDKIKRMSGLTPERPAADAPPEPMPSIRLDTSEQAQWGTLLIKELELDDEFSDFLERVHDRVADAHDLLTKLTAEESIIAIPERARTINALHATEFAAQGRKLLEKAAFTNLFAFEEEHLKFQEAMSLFRDATNRNVTALKEYLGPQLDAAQASFKEIEDEILAMLKRLEDRRFDRIRTIKEEQAAIDKLDERRTKYAQLIQSLEEDRVRVRKRVAHIEEEIRRQRALIRNDDALAALEQLSKVEARMNGTIARYAQLADDLTKYCQKNRLTIPRETRKVTDDLPRDPARTIASSAPAIAVGLTAAAQLLEEEGRGSIQQLLKRCQDAAGQATADAGRITEDLAAQKSLRQAVMRDVAAIAVYDQQQFLLRAQNEENEIARKLEFLTAELDPAKRIAHERAIRDAAVALGATIIGADSPAPVAEPLADDEPDA